MFDEQPDGDPHGDCAAEIARLNAELEKCAAALPGPIYMDPPDGGNVELSEQLRRMAQDAQRYRWLRKQHWNDSVMAVVSDPKQNTRPGTYCPSDGLLDAAIDAALTTPNAKVTGRRQAVRWTDGLEGNGTERHE